MNNSWLQRIFGVSPSNEKKESYLKETETFLDPNYITTDAIMNEIGALFLRRDQYF